MKPTDGNPASTEVSAATVGAQREDQSSKSASREAQTVAQDEARAELLAQIRFCIAEVRGDSTLSVGDCSEFVDALITAVEAHALREKDEAIARLTALLANAEAVLPNGQLQARVRELESTLAASRPQREP